VNATADAAPAVPPARSAPWVAAGILLSRIAGLVRTRVFAHYFGNSLFADAFNAALRVPNILQNLLGEGTLSASFIPVYAELVEQRRGEEAGRVAGAVFALLLAVAGGLALLGVLAAPLLVDVFAPGFEGERRALTVQLVRILFPMTGLLVLSAWALGILNSHRQFFLPYVAPVLWNAAMIATLVALGSRLDVRSLVLALGWGALLGGALQFAVQLPRVLALEPALRPRWDLGRPEVREAVRNAGPAILGRGVVQLGGMVDLFLASLLGQGAVAMLGYAQTLYLLPISLFGMSVAAAELPELARQRAGEPQALARRVEAGLRQMAVFVVPSAVGYLALGDILVAGLFQTGAFGGGDALAVSIVLAGYTLGLLASTATRLFASAFFALRDTGTPARCALVRIALAAALGYTLMIPFSRLEAGGQALGAAGLTVAAGAAAWVEWALLRRALRRRIGPVRSPAGQLARLAGAAAVAAALGRTTVAVLPPLHPALAAAAAFVPFAIAYFAAARFLGVPEASAVALRLARRLRG